jgi:DNA-binding transcriptional LysR family regulator
VRQQGRRRDLRRGCWPSGSCDPSLPAGADGLEWQPVCVDPVWVLVGERHPLAARSEAALAEFAGERWASAPGDGCFTACFAAACARAGFTPRPPLEMDVGGCIDLVAAGSAVVLCQGTVRAMPGVLPVALTGSPLRWRHLLARRPGGGQQALSIVVTADFSALVTVSFQTYFTFTHIRAYVQW